MIVLDTNVISEMMRREPDPQVMAWIADQPMAGVFTTTLTQAEIFYGLALLPEGRRRDDLLAAARPMFEVDLAGRVLPFDTDAASAYPEIAAGRKQGGKPISQIDAQIAAIVRSRGARLATRNVRDFAECGITVVDPWGKT
ncbi:plasmid stabilization protein [Sphingobium sp. 22B]|uniref:type II toxin-antitoxin system VapC family toxin n=1 Tax=unclassified Sphingobium TaxID=2611147 RepID=UPI000781B5D3|nr:MULTISPECIES: type II toxin-antitoxin system VapC family toxin [unclassified Sphingobium]KXU31395.1 plasmid stabilization protein [Sphingobium sp. AM]KYC34285.1 plasmid stabilization protein [Sphingobium sp. 22B]OAP33896.1 plasmid stabilization protein [Sphingobium sp. 20006FA]TKV41867.1 plasmid stabilization protein [Sphingobium sp. MP9-4]